MTEDQDQPGAEYELIMPFVIVASADGPFDDDAFTAGMVCGGLDAELTALRYTASGLPATPQARWFDTRYLPQVDLIAMKHNYLTDHEHTSEDNAWTYVAFGVTTDPDAAARNLAD